MMKILKKLFVTIAATATCFSAMISYSANAIILFDIDGNRYERWTEFEDYLNSSDNEIFRKSDSNYAVIKEMVTDKLSGNISTMYAPLGYDFSLYTNLDEKAEESLKNYISENYTTISFENEEEGLRLIYSEILTFEEQFEIAKEIKADTGLIAYTIVPASTIEMVEVDEDSTESTTTTTTTTAAASSTTAKKGVDSPKTGDAGLAGVLLAGAGAVAMAFALRKRED